jgi:Mn-dependent DtxR family transcriptional regulator
MIDEMKSKIYELRKLGYGYKKIAKELSLTPSAVRHVCNKMSEEELLNGRCENCGIKIKSIKGKKKKRFCSDQCRWDWWNNYNKKK